MSETRSVDGRGDRGIGDGESDASVEELLSTILAALEATDSLDPHWNALIKRMRTIAKVAPNTCAGIVMLVTSMGEEKILTIGNTEDVVSRNLSRFLESIYVKTLELSFGKTL